MDTVQSKRLTVTSISLQTRIAFETVRRRIARMEQKDVIAKSCEYGILLSTQTEFGKFIIEECKQTGKGAFSNLLHRFYSYIEK